VGADLLRWGVVADDSAGEPLSTSPIGVLARLAIACAASQMAAPDLAALLTHPLLRLGLPQADIARRAALLELALFARAVLLVVLPKHSWRSRRPARASARRSKRPFRASEQAADFRGEWDDLEDLLVRLGAQFAPLLNVRGEVTLDRWLRRTGKPSKQSQAPEKMTRIAKRSMVFLMSWRKTTRIA